MYWFLHLSGTSSINPSSSSSPHRSSVALVVWQHVEGACDSQARPWDSLSTSTRDCSHWCCKCEHNDPASQNTQQHMTRAIVSAPAVELNTTSFMNEFLTVKANFCIYSLVLVRCEFVCLRWRVGITPGIQMELSQQSRCPSLCLKHWFVFYIYFFPGESGLGKSTLINSLFLTDLYSPEFPGPSHRIKKTVQVRIATKSCSRNSTGAQFGLFYDRGQSEAANCPWLP